MEETQEYGIATDRDVTYRYDLLGQLTSVEYPSSITTTYTYDDVGRAYKVNDGANDRVADTWKGYLLEKREYASGAYLTHLDDQTANLSGYGYDSFGRIKNHRWKTSGGSLIAGWSHDYDRLDRLSGTTVVAHWYDPRNGEWQPAGEYATSGVQEFTPPASGEQDDWVLVLDDASNGLPCESQRGR